MEPGPLLWLTLGTQVLRNANYITNNNQLTNGASYITNSGGTEAATGSTVVKRDSSADINVRLVRSNYTNQTTISGAMAFRVNNGSDNYTRFCSDGAAIRTFIGAGTSSFNGAYSSLSGRPTIPVDLTASGTGTVHANNYVNTQYVAATSGTFGLVKIGYGENGKNYPVELSSGQMYVNVPWTDNNDNTITRVGISGSLVSGDITISASGAATATQSGNTVNIHSVNTNTEYTANNGVQLTGTVFGLSSNMNTIALSVDSLVANKIDVGVLDADSVISRDIRVGASGSEALVGNSTGAAAMTAGKTYIITSLGNTSNTTWSGMAGTPSNQFQGSGYPQVGYEEYNIGDIITISSANTSAGSGTGVEVSGEGAHLNQDGDFLVGKVSTKNLMYFDSGTGQLIMGEIKVKEINDIVLKKGTNQSLALGSGAIPRNNCVYVGYGANGQGYGNTSVGQSAGTGIGFNNTSYASNGTAAENTTIGYNAGYNKISGSKNVFLGANVARVQAGTGSPSLSGDENIGIGGHADSSEVVGGTCIFGELTTGSGNISIGSSSGYQLTTGSSNTFLGTGSGAYLTTGSSNLLLGVGAGSAIITGSNNVIIGNFSGTGQIDPFGASSNNLVLSDGSGNIKLKFNSSHNATFTGTINSGAITSTGNVTAFSDERLKTEIQTLDGKKVLEMRGVEFIKDGVKGSGVIAQELEKVAPELVLDGEYKSVAYGNITGYLIEAIKEQQSEINELKDLVKQLLEK